VVVGLVVANTLNAGVDIGAIAAGINLLVPVPILLHVVPIVLLLLILQIWGSYRLIASIFKWLTLALFAYIGSAFFARPDLTAVLRGSLVPTIQFNSAFLAMFVALLGTTISPYLFFWQASQEVEEKHARSPRRLWRKKGCTDTELQFRAVDVNIGMGFSNLVMYFIILATAATLHRAGQTDIQTATEAAEALRPLAGEVATILLALGLIGSGLLAVPILTGSGAYAVCEALGWRFGLSEKPENARRFYAVIAACTLVGAAINFLGINPLRALCWTAVINGLLAPPLLVIIMIVSNNRTIMGPRANSRTLNILGWLTTLLMFAAAVGLVLAWGVSFPG
jgi:Mn2+/Fe2+ NRAMP family transporter